MQHDAPALSDEEIVRQIVEGNVDAFEFLLKRHQELVLRIVRKHLPPHDLEETVQDIFVRAYRSLTSFRRKGDFSHWLSAIAVRTCYDYWRRVYRAKEISLSGLSDGQMQWLSKAMADGPGAAGAYGSQREARELLDRALARLSAEDRMVLELIYFEGYTVKEAAELLGWSISNVKIRSFRSRKKLRKIITAWLARR